GAHAFPPAQGETERQACAHRVSCEEERTLRQCDGQLFLRGVPTACRCALAVLAQVRRGHAKTWPERLSEMIERAAVAGEPVQEGERLAGAPIGRCEGHLSSRAAATMRCSSRWRSTFSARPVRTSTMDK